MEVEKGWAKLEGTVGWQCQKEAAENAVRHIVGVKGVTNRIAVKSPVTSTEVKEKIEKALKRSAEVDAQGITVETIGDNVILRGNVRSFAERKEAERAAWAAPGVSVVENHIKIDFWSKLPASHGTTGLLHHLIGSVADKATRSATCPVYLVRGPK